MSFDPNVQPAQRQRGMESFKILLAAGVPSPAMPINGDYIHILLASVDDLKVRFDSGKPNSVHQGLGFRRYYSDVSFESATGQEIEVLLGFGSVADGRATANVNVTTNIAPGNTFRLGGDIACADVSTTLLLAADPDRLYAVITNESSNTATVRIGPATVDADTGIPLEPGQSLPIGTTAAIYAWNGSGAPVTISAASVAEV